MSEDTPLYGEQSPTVRRLQLGGRKPLEEACDFPIFLGPLYSLLLRSHCCHPSSPTTDLLHHVLSSHPQTKIFLLVVQIALASFALVS